MKAPYPWRIKDPDKVWECNSDPARLDQFYIKFLGRGGEKVLTDEIKWLAITHKSFDQGRRGFNDRLAFFGLCPCGGGRYRVLILRRTTDYTATDEYGFTAIANSDEHTVSA